MCCAWAAAFIHSSGGRRGGGSPGQPNPNPTLTRETPCCLSTGTERGRPGNASASCVCPWLVKVLCVSGLLGVCELGGGPYYFKFLILSDKEGKGVGRGQRKRGYTRETLARNGYAQVPLSSFVLMCLTRMQKHTGHKPRSSLSNGLLVAALCGRVGTGTSTTP